jgi:DNA polymerase I-like protein with 3'-5' exonuclease and polymerase domains
MAETDGILDRVTLHRVNDLDTLDEFRRWLGQPRQLLCADTESAGLNSYRDRHRLTQVGDLWDGWAFGPGWFGAVNEVISRYPGRIGWFNSGYDWQVLQHWDGVRPRWEATDDAQLAAHIHDSQRVNKLKPRAAIEIDRRAAAFERTMNEGMAANKWNYATVPEDWAPYWQYGALDPVLTAHLLAKFLPVVRGQFSRNYDLELAYARCCANMSTAGMMIDRPYIHEWMRKITDWSAPASAWLRDYWGVTNPGSNEQVGHALDRAQVPILKRTPTGKPKADKDTLELYAAMYPEASHLINALISVKKAESIITRCFAKFLDLAGDDDVVHASIHSTGAQRTGRSSVSDPPLQQRYRDVPQIRGSFIPRPGHVFVSWDADQIEARLAAHFSRDRRMIADFAEADATGQSFFLIQAAGIYREQITKKD